MDEHNYWHGEPVGHDGPESLKDNNTRYKRKRRRMDLLNNLISKHCNKIKKKKLKTISVKI